MPSQRVIVGDGREVLAGIARDPDDAETAQEDAMPTPTLTRDAALDRLDAAIARLREEIDACTSRIQDIEAEQGAREDDLADLEQRRRSLGSLDGADDLLAEPVVPPAAKAVAAAPKRGWSWDEWVARNRAYRDLVERATIEGAVGAVPW